MNYFLTNPNLTFFIPHKEIQFHIGEHKNIEEHNSSVFYETLTFKDGAFFI